MKLKFLLLTLCFLALNHIAQAQNLKYVSANNSWNPDSLGNQRVLVNFKGSGNVAHVNIGWRRRDHNPELKRIIVQDAKTGYKVFNVFSKNVTRESGEVYFEAISGKGNYYIYYLPYKSEGASNYPKGKYLEAEQTASSVWLSKAEKTEVNTVALEIQSVNAFNSFYPMEVIATAKETAAVQSKYAAKAYVVYPEARMFPIKMQNDLPYRWIEKGVSNVFNGSADRGENYALQLGIYALRDLKNVKVGFSDLKTSNGKIIVSKNINCINTNGTSYDNKPLTRVVNVAKGAIQALWCTINVPQATSAGTYSGKFTVTVDGNETQTIDVKLNVSNRIAINHGFNDPIKQTRLNWLNSTLAQDNKVVAPYTDLKIKGNEIELLGRKFEINSNGLPKRIQTFFTPEMTGYQQKANDVITEPIHFHFYSGNNQEEKFTNQTLKITDVQAGIVKWMASNISENLQMDIQASIEFDGYVSYQVKVTALNDVSLNDVQFHIPYTKEASKYLMGLGQKGDLRPDSINWKWDVAHKSQDAVWIGAVNAGLFYNLRDENYVRPLNTNFYLQKPLLLPTSWGNDNKGGINIGVKGKSVLASNYSGAHSMKKGEVLYYNFNLLITPFHPINTEFQWSNRFFHKYGNLDSIKNDGANVVNIHHATPINPWINYPFIEWKKMKNYIDEAHQKGLKVKIYNTVRELSNHAYELPALRSLGNEVYSPGKGGGFSWLQEHVDSNYIAAWFVPEIKDAAIINSGMNRWHNYYVEGMNWLVKNVGIDGIYLDDVAFDRVTMKRVKRVLTQDGHPGIIDLHSANQYNKSDGFNNSSILYMEHFPYLNRLWFGEYFDYEKNNQNFFLTEVSGIPFGLMGEMLQGNGNLWRGMVYGMTNRLGWFKESDPRPLWKAWNEFGIKGSKLIGYWSENCPVKTDNPNVLATVYQKDGKAMVALASFANTEANVKLIIDWQKLGVDANKAKITAKAIQNFQPKRSFNISETIPVEKAKGWLLVIE